jgi:MFS-type transporter involved in bile tolerance (Atg22 family)
MEYLVENLKLFGILYVVSIICTVMFSEIVKKFDKNDKLKGYKVWLPFIFSCGFSVLLKFILKIDWTILVFVEASMFGFSVFGYETFLKSVQRIIERIASKGENIISESKENQNEGNA